MTIVSNDPSWWPSINLYRISSYYTVAAYVVLMYDWVLTFGQEVGSPRRCFYWCLLILASRSKLKRLSSSRESGPGLAASYQTPCDDRRKHAIIPWYLHPPPRTLDQLKRRSDVLIDDVLFSHSPSVGRTQMVRWMRKRWLKTARFAQYRKWIGNRR
ncbi:hypothetical protein EDD22DRAFT_189061 [Suillus occidentalis]|nr:hypothetical protein EDD22DRAFT_189061 [Suillus occidentalis]